MNYSFIFKNVVLLGVFFIDVLKRFIFFIIVFNSLLLTVLGNIPDSLEKRLERATSDTAKVMVYNRFAQELLTGKNRNYYQIQQYAMESRRNQDYQQSLQYAQQGLILAEQLQFDKGRAELYRTMGSACFYMSDYEKAMEHYEKALEICEKLQDMNGMALNNYNIALVLETQQTKIIDQLENLQKALSLWKQIGNTDKMARAYQSIIQLYRDVAEWQLAKNYVDEALNLALETENRHDEAFLYSIYAQICSSTGDVQQAGEYYQKSLHVYENLGEQLRIARMTANIATSLHSDDPEMAIDLLRKSVAIYEKISPTNSILFEIYNHLANQFQIINNYDSIKYYKEKALSKAILSGNQQSISDAYYLIGVFHLNHGDVDQAEKEFRQSYDTALKSGLYREQSNALWELSAAKGQKGDYKKAFEYLQKYQIINDSLDREENKRTVQQLTMQYEFEKDMKKNSETIKAQLERQQQAIKYQQIIVAIISIALIGAAILLLFIIRSNKFMKQANAKLKHQHHEILRINNELKESHNELSKYKDSLEEMVEKQTEKIRQSEIQLRTLSNNLPGGCIYQKLVFQDGKEIISYISSTAEKWLGISAESVMNDINRFNEQMMPEDIERKRELEQESIRTMSSHTIEYRLMKDDQEIWVLENAMPRTDKNQKIVWDGIVVDITDRKKYEKDLIVAKERAEESDRLKSAFLANMSHEIRTPMNGIVGFLGFIERDDLPVEKRHTYTGIIRSNVQQLLQLIGDIVDISKMDSHQLSLNHVTFDLNILLNELETFFQDFILKHDKKLELILDRSQFISPCIINSDPVRIRQILSNLIGNAVKFTDKGYIRFGYELTEQRDQLYFFVEDTGIGIPESKLEYIFERFRQAHDEKTQTLYGGTGLGLAISKNLVEMMNGRIGVKSGEGTGSTFHFTLPFLPEKS